MHICYLAHAQSDSIDSTLKERVMRMARIAKHMSVCVVRSSAYSELDNLGDTIDVIYVDEHPLSYITARRVKKACNDYIVQNVKHLCLVADAAEEVGVYARSLASVHGIAYSIFVHNEIRCEAMARHAAQRLARVLREARVIIVPSMRVKKTCDACVGQDLSSIVDIIPFPISIPEVSDRKPDIYNNRYPVFFLDAIHMCKADVSTALLGFAPVARRYPKALLVVSGCAMIQEGTKEFVHTESLEGNIECLPPLSDADRALYIAYADLVLFTPTHAGYGAGLVRALLSGTPAVTTDVGIVGSLVTLDDALICPPSDSTCLTKRLLLLLDNPAILKSLKEATLRMKEKFPRTVSNARRYDMRVKDVLE